jgi:hypothetical protein
VRARGAPESPVPAGGGDAPEFKAEIRNYRNPLPNGREIHYNELQEETLCMEKRRFVRYASSAKVRINTYTQILVLMRDISLYGCCLSYPDTQPASMIDLEADREYILEVFPETETIGIFSVNIKPRWTRIKGEMRETGCLINGFPAKEDKEKFTAYIDWQANRA